MNPFKLWRGKKSKINSTPSYELLVEYFQQAHMGQHGGRIIMKIKCNLCGSISYNQNDVKYKYCARCKMFHC